MSCHQRLLLFFRVFKSKFFPSCFIMEASKSISNGVAKYIKISIIESGTIKVVSNRLSIDSIPGIFFGS